MKTISPRNKVIYGGFDTRAVHQAAFPDKALDVQPRLAPSLTPSLLPLHSLHSGHVSGQRQFWETGHHLVFSQSATFSVGLVLCSDLGCLSPILRAAASDLDAAILSYLILCSSCSCQTGHVVRGLLRLPSVPTLIQLPMFLGAGLRL